MKDVLLAHAQLAGVLAGFSTIVAAFQRPLTDFQKHRFLTILFTALLQIIACLVPVWLAEIRNIGPFFWHAVSGVYLGFSVLLWVALVFPLRKMESSAIIAINKPISWVIYLLGLSSFVVLIVNTMNSEVAGFGLYYSSLLAGLTIVFFIFADVALRNE